MTDSQPKRPISRRWLPRISEIDPEELRYLRAQYLSELADWILNHPALGAGVQGNSVTPSDVPVPDPHTTATRNRTTDETHAGPESPVDSENKA